jgi:uncharacterized membrane protein
MRSEENTGSGVTVTQSIWSVLRQNLLLSSMALIGVVGLGISIYLTTIHYTHTAPVCSIGGIVNCANVLKSPYSVIPGTGNATTGIPITFPGGLWFVVSGGLAVVGLVCAYRDRPEPERLPLIQLLWAGGGLLFVFYLVFDEIVRLHNICEWCTAIHFLTLITVMLAWYRFASPESAAPATAVEYLRPAHPAKGPRTGSAHGYALPRSVRSRAASGHTPAKARNRRG